MQSNAGSFRLFRLFGINVWLHWSWFVVAYLQFQLGGDRFSNAFWHIATYLSLFGIVLLHEFGHSLACKSVGGQADDIVLWPLGGVAYVQPPARPGAVLWSIAAGPLVNVLLIPVTFGLLLLIIGLNLDNDPDTLSDPETYVIAVASINVMLLVFNMLPVYPLDGGQILQAILWFFIGQVASLRVAAGIGMVAAALGGGWAFWRQDSWLVIIACFIGWRSYQGYRIATAIQAIQLQQESGEQVSDQNGQKGSLPFDADR